jgi:hypothetical protein
MQPFFWFNLYFLYIYFMPDTGLGAEGVCVCVCVCVCVTYTQMYMLGLSGRALSSMHQALE